MRKCLSTILTLIICFCFFITPAYAAETTIVDGLTYPRNFYCNERWTGINAQSLLQVESFKLSISEDYHEKVDFFYVNLYFSDGAFSLWSPGYDSDEIVVVKYNAIAAEAERHGYDIENLTGVEVSVNTTSTILCVIDVQEEAGFVSKIINSITGYFEERTNLVFDIFGKFINLISNLFDNFSGYTIEPVLDFLGQIEIVAINVWLSIFTLPMMSDIMMISVVIGLFSALMSFLKSRS